MLLYRFEVTTADGNYNVIICAKNDEQAFKLVDIELEKYFSRSVDVYEITLFEKKHLRGGAGFVLERG